LCVKENGESFLESFLEYSMGVGFFGNGIFKVN
jgi:hypothetical protein